MSHATAGEMTVWLSQVALDEVERTLQRQAPQGMPRFHVLRDQLAGVLAVPGRDLLGEVARVVAPKDAPIVAGAIARHAEYLISYNRRHLIARAVGIERAFGIPVLTPADLLLTTGLPKIQHP